MATQGGELSRHGVLRRKYMDWTVGEARTMSSSPKRLLQWLLLRLPVPCSLVLFLLLSTILLEAFLGYQLYLVAKVRLAYSCRSQHVPKWRSPGRALFPPPPAPRV
eukprot:355434-Chlamydomonas_euryale.AAC.7